MYVLYEFIRWVSNIVFMMCVWESLIPYYFCLQVIPISTRINLSANRKVLKPGDTSEKKKDLLSGPLSQSDLISFLSCLFDLRS